MSAQLAQVVRELLDAYGGDFPDWIRGEAAAVADELAAIEAEADGPHMAAIAHMRCAERFAREIGDRRLFKHVRAAVEAVERHAGRMALPFTAELQREEQRLAAWPDPVPPEGEK